MRDRRIDRWADVLVNYALQAKSGQHAVIVGEYEALPLIEASYEKFIQKGVVVDVVMSPSAFKETLFAYASDELLSTPSPVTQYIADHCDLYLAIGAEGNSKLLSGVDPKRQAMASQARQPVLEAILNRAAAGKMRWSYTMFPTAAAAQDAEMGTKAYEEMIFNLGALNQEDPVAHWKKVEAEQQKIIDYLSDKHELRFRNPMGTDLRVNISGMKWVNCCGKINFPDGEVYTGPNLKASDGGVNGIARYSFPTLYRNTEVHEIELKFEEGAVVEANASKGQEFLREMIAQDTGAKFVGEIAIGTNYQMTTVTKNILFDEKFGGTFHLALGKGYPQTGNTNASALHWDMIFDLRNGGSITADEKEFYRDGQFLNL
ncbi:Aminopeptidase [Waddlia chondrophila 2032/99]|uniref:Aminopeptidase n=1 Tax=Waddlia chondrophila 2032/99 TaxID=765953 RepID=F8LAE6_9BACT|nr:Aminopeptidase [Waddlia chondrophila 2032/99]